MIKKKKQLYKLSTEWNFLNLIKNIYQKNPKKQKTYIIPSGETLKAFLKGDKARMSPFHQLLFNILLEV